MKALAKLERGIGLTFVDFPIPAYGMNEVLIKVRKTALCGTDLHIYQWDAWAQDTIPVPMIIGHEFCGEIVALGDEVKGLSIGQRVSGEGHITCGMCRHCRAGQRHLCRATQGLGVHRAGCFAEYVVLPASNVIALPDSIPDTIGAILDPLGNAVHSALAFNMIGEDVLITGAGPIGLMTAQIARHIGARYVVITDTCETRLVLARSMGITHAINPTVTPLAEVMKTLGMQEGFDVGLEMSGHPEALRQMIESMAFGGKIVLLGILPKHTEVSGTDIIFKSLTIKGIYGREMFETWYKMMALLQGGLNISGVITHEFKAEDFEQAFDLIQKGQSGKVILSWT